MLELAVVGPSDVVYDLGSGDGRMVIHAAKQYGAHGVGVDQDPVRIQRARRHAVSEGVADLVSFECADAFDVNLGSATVVVLYMSREWNDGILAKLHEELPVGARVVSWNHDFAGWPPRLFDIVPIGDEGTRVYLWEIERHRDHG